MVTSLNNSIPGRDGGFQSVQYLRRTVNFNSGPLAAGPSSFTVPIGTLPAGAAVVPNGGIWVTTAFAGGTTPTIDIGTPTTPALYGSALSAAAIAFVPLDDAALAAAAPANVEVPIQARFNWATLTPTAGVAEVLLPYITRN
jgi:hypothetical protein